MRKLLLLLFLLFSLTLTAQDYIPMLEVGNSWGVEACFFGDCEGVHIVEILGEEIINGKTYKVLNNETCLLREENGVVYVLNEDLSENVFLDFTLQIGDSFFLQDLEDNCLNGADTSMIDEFRITAIETQFILGQDRKVLYMDYYEDGIQFDMFGEEEIWIEGIGSTGGIGPEGFLWDLDIELRCFTNNGETIRIIDNEIFDTTEPCEESTAGVDEFLLNQINIAPNPVTEITTLAIPLEISEASIKVFDVNGKQLFEERITAKNTSLDFSSITSGLYFYQIYSKNELLITKKLLVL